MQTDLKTGIVDEASDDKTRVVTEATPVIHCPTTSEVKTGQMKGLAEPAGKVAGNGGATSDDTIDARKLSLSERVEALKLWMRDPLSRVESNVVLEALHVRNIANAQFKLLKYGVLDIPSYEVLPNSPHKKLTPLYKGCKSFRTHQVLSVKQNLTI